MNLYSPSHDDSDRSRRKGEVTSHFTNLGAELDAIYAQQQERGVLGVSQEMGEILLQWADSAMWVMHEGRWLPSHDFKDAAADMFATIVEKFDH